MIHNHETETEVLEEVLTEETSKHSIVLYNDDVNTFDFVIKALIEICKHGSEQAEQCTWLVHYKGRCDVKNGDYDTLKPICEELLNRSLTAEIH